MEIREKEFLDNQNKLKEIIEYYHKNNILMEIVTCKEKIQDGDKYRFGRFVFENDKHHIMLNRKGYYFLIVKNGHGIINAKLVSALDIGKRKIVSWKEFFN